MLDIVFVYREGRLSGEAFALVQNSVAVDVALGKHKMMLGRRYIEISVARKEVNVAPHPFQSCLTTPSPLSLSCCLSCLQAQDDAGQAIH